MDKKLAASADAELIDLRGETCDSCGHSEYAEGGPNGTVACGLMCSVNRKTSWACCHWMPRKAGAQRG